MNIASIFNYFEAALWFSIALTVFLRRKNANIKLTKLAVVVSISFSFLVFLTSSKPIRARGGSRGGC